ncbi:MAG: DUF1893 domain-containing protein [Prevotella sp.]
METLSQILKREHCSLVVRDVKGNVTLYYKKGVRDLEYLLKQYPDRLKGAEIADKVIGKAAAAMAVVGGVRSIYAEVMSRKALPLLQEAGVDFSYGELVDKIVIAKGDNRCPLENIVEDCQTAEETVATLQRHFMEMTLINNTNRF